MESDMLGKKVIVRTFSAGVFYGTLLKKEGKEVKMANARRLWYWSGANSLSELAEKGVKYPESCKFPVAVKTVELTEAIEILETTEEAQKSVEAVPVWSVK
jgi:hypothetical protein